MGKFIYFEGHSGISGDMAVASLLDLGADAAKLDAVLKTLPAEFTHSVERGHSYSMAGCCFNVHHHHDHPHEEHYHAHAHHHHHEHRHLADVEAIIDAAAMSDSARALAKRIFRIVAEAEAEAHGVSVDEVHFHEVGAIDSIVDIVAAAVLLDDLGADGCIVTGLSEGSGTVMCQHGELPVPVPAVMNIARAHGITLRPTSTQGEMVTPTGIAIAAAARTRDTLPAAYKILKCGVGLGKRDFGRANFLRTFLIEDAADPQQIFECACNVDDSTPEALGYALQKVLEAGARDAWFTPCYMKKNRPAVQVGALADAEHLQAVEDALLRHTGTIGVRRHPVERTTMERRIVTVQTPYGPVQVKECRYGDIVRRQPEYDSAAAAAEREGVPLEDVFQAARNAAGHNA
ncbi:MAG: nickel pincer cofactor biosynthesis protein LarC [Akkermansia sp.]|nr:nickel pincer cofactor biosynthesis protein LarC [Akkermansia sp.]